MYFYLGECYAKANQPAQALPYFDRLIQEFEQSEHLAEAQKRVELLKAEIANQADPAKAAHRSRRFSELLNRLDLLHREDVVESPVVVDS